MIFIKAPIFSLIYNINKIILYTLILTEQHIINKQHSLWKQLDSLCFLSKNLGYGRGKYAGRIFLIMNIISFWHYPENKQILLTVLEDIQNKWNQTHPIDWHINFKDTKWKIEVPKGFTKIKKEPLMNQGKFGNYPDWGNWYPEKGDTKYIKTYE